MEELAAKLLSGYILFTVASCLFDLLIVVGLVYVIRKVFSAKIILAENNREIHEHDKIILDLKQTIKK